MRYSDFLFGIPMVFWDYEPISPWVYFICSGKKIRNVERRGCSGSNSYRLQKKTLKIPKPINLKPSQIQSISYPLWLLGVIAIPCIIFSPKLSCVSIFKMAVKSITLQKFHETMDLMKLCIMGLHIYSRRSETTTAQ